MAFAWRLFATKSTSGSTRGAISALATWNPLAADAWTGQPAAVINPSVIPFGNCAIGSQAHLSKAVCVGQPEMTTSRPPLSEGRGQALLRSYESFNGTEAFDYSEDARPSCSSQVDIQAKCGRRVWKLPPKAIKAPSLVCDIPISSISLDGLNTTPYLELMLRKPSTAPMTCDNTLHSSYLQHRQPQQQPSSEEPSQPALKSAKRQAAEALLAARFSHQEPPPSALFPNAALCSYLPYLESCPAPPHRETPLRALPLSSASASPPPSPLWSARPSSLDIPFHPSAGHIPSDPCCSTLAAQPSCSGQRFLASAAAAGSRGWQSSDPSTLWSQGRMATNARKSPAMMPAAGNAATTTGGKARKPGPTAMAVDISQRSTLQEQLQQLRQGTRAVAHEHVGLTGWAEPPQQPAAKRPRISLSETAANSLGPPDAAAGPQRLQMTVVPACDPGRGCKALLAAIGPIAAPIYGAAGAAAALDGSANGCVAVGAAATGAGRQGSSSVAAATSPSVPWCSFEVKLPSLNWQTVFEEPPGSLQRFSLGRGYEKLTLPEGLVSYIVESPKHAADAISKLKASMQDRVVAIDLEWRPETVAGRVSPVACLQLSTASVCLILRTSSMGFALPPPVAAFLTDPSVVVLGFGWESADEKKMRSTFGLGRASFRRFVDLQEVAACLGYHNFGLARLAQQVLGVPLHKSKSVSRSNWAAPQLTNHQLKYASLDVFVAGQLFRALRLWHSSPSPCASCRSPIGDISTSGLLRCSNRGCNARAWPSLAQHKSHCTNTGHKLRYDSCTACGRVYELRTAEAADGGEVR